jgi:hypothetical protein
LNPGPWRLPSGGVPQFWNSSLKRKLRASQALLTGSQDAAVE